jgi:hypothetical protein
MDANEMADVAVESITRLSFALDDEAKKGIAFNLDAVFGVLNGKEEWNLEAGRGRPKSDAVDTVRGESEQTN